MTLPTSQFPTVASKQMKTLGVDVNCSLYILMVDGTFKGRGKLIFEIK